MPFYETDDMTCWFYGQLEEDLDEQDTSDDWKGDIKSAVLNNDRAKLKDLCDDTLETRGITIEGPFRYAVLNSVDYDLLTELLKEHIETADAECEGCGVRESMECKSDCSYQAKKREEAKKEEKPVFMIKTPERSGQTM